jgi:hypothetical protein
MRFEQPLKSCKASRQEDKEDIVQETERKKVIDDDSSTEWEDIEHGAEEEPSDL